MPVWAKLGFFWAVLGLELCLFFGTMFSTEVRAGGPRFEEFGPMGPALRYKRFFYICFPGLAYWALGKVFYYYKMIMWAQIWGFDWFYAL